MLCHAVLFKAVKRPRKCYEIDSIKLQKQQYTPNPNSAKQKRKYLTIYSINITCTIAQQYYLFVSTFQTNSHNYFYYTKNLCNANNSRKTSATEN